MVRPFPGSTARALRGDRLNAADPRRRVLAGNRDRGAGARRAAAHVRALAVDLAVKPEHGGPRFTRSWRSAASSRLQQGETALSSPTRRSSIERRWKKRRRLSQLPSTNSLARRGQFCLTLERSAEALAEARVRSPRAGSSAEPRREPCWPGILRATARQLKESMEQDGGEGRKSASGRRKRQQERCAKYVNSHLGRGRRLRLARRLGGCAALRRDRLAIPGPCWPYVSLLLGPLP